MEPINAIKTHDNAATVLRSLISQPQFGGQKEDLERLLGFVLTQQMFQAEYSDLLKYQEQAGRTAPMELSPSLKTATFAMGLAGEAGEVVDLLKKFVGHGHALDTGKLLKELGDVLWYVSALATQFDLSLRDIAVENILKLRARYPQGFSSEASLNRKEG